VLAADIQAAGLADARVGDAVLAKWDGGATMHAAAVTRVNPPSVRLQVVEPGRAVETDVTEERVGDCPDKAVGARCRLQVRLTEVRRSCLRLSTSEQDVDANLMVPGTPVLYVDGDAPAVPAVITTMQTMTEAASSAGQGTVEIVLHDILLQQFRGATIYKVKAATKAKPVRYSVVMDAAGALDDEPREVGALIERPRNWSGTTHMDPPRLPPGAEVEVGASVLWEKRGRSKKKINPDVVARLPAPFNSLVFRQTAGGKASGGGLVDANVGSLRGGDVVMVREVHENLSPSAVVTMDGGAARVGETVLVDRGEVGDFSRPEAVVIEAKVGGEKKTLRGYSVVMKYIYRRYRVVTPTVRALPGRLSGLSVP
jgi:hypothetical protein